MILVAGTALILFAAMAARVRLTSLSTVRFRAVGVLLAALLVQVVILQVLAERLPFQIAAALHLGSYALAGAFVWCNRAVPGLWIFAAGGMANFAAIAANGGVMPASATALAASGQAETAGFANSASVEGAQLAFLGDVFAWPAPLPFANVFSVGDVLLLVGVALFVFRVGRRSSAAAAMPAGAR